MHKPHGNQRTRRGRRREIWLLLFTPSESPGQSIPQTSPAAGGDSWHHDGNQLAGKQVISWAAKDREVSRVPALGLNQHLHPSSPHRSFRFSYCFHFLWCVSCCAPTFPLLTPGSCCSASFHPFLLRKPVQGSKEAPGPDAQGQQVERWLQRDVFTGTGAEQIEGSLLCAGASGHGTQAPGQKMLRSSGKRDKKT